jgi:hypothetical protein
MEDRDKGPESDGEIRPELMEQFEDWQKTQSSHDLAEGGGASFVSLDSSSSIRRVRRTRQIRWITFLVVATLSGMGLWGSRLDIAYFFSPSEAVSMGDLRVAYVEGVESLPAKSNRYVQADGLIATLIHDANQRQYFFCPLYNLLVRTPNPVRLPVNKVVHEIDPVDEKLLRGQKALVWELAVDVSVKGRLVALSDLPGRWMDIWKHFAPDTEGADSARGVEASRVHVLIDGGLEDEERPGAYLRHVLVGGASLAITFITGFFYRRARRDEEALIEALTKG